MAIITPAVIDALQTSFVKHFQDGLAQAPSQYKEIATVVASTTKSNTYGWLGQWPAAREWIGDRVLKDMAAHAYQIQNKDFESTVGVKRTDIEDDQLGIYAPLFREMGLEAGRFPDKMLFNLLKSGHTVDCYDGKPFFNDKHPVYPNVDGTGTAKDTVNNYGKPSDTTPVWYLLDTSRALKPLIYQERKAPFYTYMTDPTDEDVFMKNAYRFGFDLRANCGFGFWQMAARSSEELNKTNFEKVFDGMRLLKGDGGNPLDIRPNILLVPTALYNKAIELVGVARLQSGADNPNHNRVKIMESAWLN